MKAIIVRVTGNPDAEQRKAIKAGVSAELGVPVMIIDEDTKIEVLDLGEDVAPTKASGYELPIPLHAAVNKALSEIGLFNVGSVSLLLSPYDQTFQLKCSGIVKLD